MRNLDRTSWIGVLVCLGLLFAWGWWSSKEAARYAEEQRVAREAEERRLAEAPPPPEAVPAPAEEEPDEEPAVAEQETVLANDHIRLRLTNRGASVRVTELLQHRRHLGGEELIAVNENSEHGIGTLSSGPGEFDSAVWRVVEETPVSVAYETDTPDGLQLIKTFRLPGEGDDPYEFSLELSVRNDSGAAFEFADDYLYAGSASPLHFNEWSMQIGKYWMPETGKFQYKTIDHYGGRKFLGVFGKNEIPADTFNTGTLRWAGVNDQFFTTIVKPEVPYTATMWGSRIPVVLEDDEETSRRKRMFAAEAGVGLPRLAMNAGDQTTLRYRIFTGPKEFSRLRALGDERQRVMNYDEIPVFGWLFGWAIKPLASWLIGGLTYIYRYVGDYGVAIILITVLIRLLIWPIYAKSARSMKRMSKLAPMMTEIREKHADNPQKMNEEMMKLYRTYRINPLGGCLPMLLQLPVFLAFYRMLWSAVELRHESFLWVSDLAMPDTLFVIPGFNIPFNLLPILMGFTSFVQIAITPKTGDKTQRIIFMLMPVIFLVICYNFAAALSLYWTISNVFSILQTWLMNKLPDPELKARPVTNRKGFLQRMQEQAEAAKKARGGTAAGPVPGASRTKLPGEKGARHTKGKGKKKRR